MIAPYISESSFSGQASFKLFQDTMYMFKSQFGTNENTSAIFKVILKYKPCIQVGIE